MVNFLNFLDSNFLQTLVTLAVGFVAFSVYNKQQKDRRKAAANSVFLEIQHIEHCLPKIKAAVRNGSLDNLDFNVIRDDSWAKYSHLFSTDFDKDEWETITDFYQNARILDESIRESAKSFSDDIAQIRYNKQRMFAEITKNVIDAPQGEAKETIDAYNKKMEVFNKLYMSRQGELFTYTPVKYVNDAKKSLEDMEKISITNIGAIFKRIIGYK